MGVAVKDHVCVFLFCFSHQQVSAGFYSEMISMGDKKDPACQIHCYFPWLRSTMVTVPRHLQNRDFKQWFKLFGVADLVTEMNDQLNIFIGNAFKRCEIVSMGVRYDQNFH